MLDMGVLDELLGGLRQQGAVFSRVIAGGHWKLRKPGCPAPSFYIALSGRFHVLSDGIDHHLAKGDVLILPHGRAHDIYGEDSAFSVPEDLYEVFSTLGIPPMEAGDAVSL